MNFAALLARVDRLQKGMAFKLIASGLILLAAGIFIGGYALNKASANAGTPAASAPAASAPAAPAAPGTPIVENPDQVRQTTARQAASRLVEDLRSRRASVAGAAVGTLLVTTLLLAVVWLGLLLTYLALALLGALVVVPLILFSRPQSTERGFALFFAGACVLSASFVTCVQGLRLLFSVSAQSLGVVGTLMGDSFRVVVLALVAGIGGLILSGLLQQPWLAGALGTAGLLVQGFSPLALALTFWFILFLMSVSPPALAVARNVVAEAVRMKLSVVFIVMLILTLAAVPTLLDASNPLRYRVQSFLQYGTAGVFTLIAALVVFLATASTAFEQRDKIIWQTMTKPVHPWEYVIGKWLGAIGVGAVLLAVSAAGIFLFTEYLRNQKAVDEIAPYVTAQGREVSADRLALEYQVLVGRATRSVEIPANVLERIEQETKRVYNDELKKYEDDAQRQAQLNNPPSFAPPDLVKIHGEISDALTASFRSVTRGEPGMQIPSSTFEFDHLDAARTIGKPISLRLKVNAGANLPFLIYHLSFTIPGFPTYTREVQLNQMLTIPLSSAAIDARGRLIVAISNGDEETGQFNPETITFPPDGLEVSFPVSTFAQNYFRVILVFWLKLAFLAMVAVAAATFLSFPVAALTAFGVFFCAECAGFLHTALDTYQTVGYGKEFLWWRIPIILIAEPISRLFAFYADLKPTTNLVEGLNLSWAVVARAASLIGALNLVIFAIAVSIFRRRELATYSGQ